MGPRYLHLKNLSSRFLQELCEDSHWMTEAEIRLTQLQVKECHGMPATTGNEEEARTCSVQSQREQDPANTLISVF